MTNLPTGTATFLFTDIEGSTPLWERDPEGMREALALHNAVLADAIAAHDGHWFKTVGDAFQAAFADPAQAVRAALAGQRGLAQAEWGHTGPLLVRMGIHTGPAIAEETDYVATHTLNRVARIMSAAHGGQIILSQEVLDEIAHRMPEEITLRDMGKHRMKGLTHLEHLYQVVAPDLPAEYPRLSTLDISPNNLPLQLTSFIGREKELREVMELLSTGRLVTLTGPGGCGKTRLSLEIAEKVQDTHPHGVWLVELAPLADPALIPQTLAAVLGLREEGDRPNLTVLTDFLRTRTLFLVLDNCEHLIEACARLADGLLKACPKIQILASSRETLGISGEAAYRIPSLGVPDLHRQLPVDQLLQYASVKLFVERAGTVLPDFTVTDDNAPAVVQVCHRLDGIPLAFELAAARVKMLAVEQIAARLDDRFRLLTGGSRTALPRQQTLRALIDWSFGLLSEQECVLFRRLSVFAGGWTLDAAEAVCSDKDESGRMKDENHPSAFILHPFDVLDLLSHLVNKSLVIVDREQGKDARYRLLETIRQYARDKLLESSEVGAVRDRHLRYFVEVAEEAEPQLRGAGLVPWMRRLNQELDNLRAAMEWAREDGEGAAVGYNAVEYNRVELGLRLASSLWWFAFIGNIWKEEAVWECLLRIGNVFLCQGEFSKALEHFTQIAPASHPKPEFDDLAWKHLYLMMTYTHLGRLDEAEQALESARSYGVQGGSFYSTFKLAEVEVLFYLASGNVQNVHKPVQDLITLCQRNRNFPVLTVALEFQVWAFYMAHRLAESVHLFSATSAFRAQKEMPMLNKDQLLYGPVIASLQSRLGEAVFNEAWGEGRDMTMEQAIAYALEE